MVSPSGRDAEILNLSKLLRQLIAAKWFLFATSCAGALLLGVAAMLQISVYRAETILVPGDTGGNASGSLLDTALGSIGSLGAITGASMGGGAQRRVEEALAVMRSRAFTERFIDEKGLLPRLYAAEWDEELGKWKERAPSLAKAYKYFDRSIRTVFIDSRTGLITVRIEWRDPVEAAEWANDMVRRLNMEMRNRAVEDADAFIGYLEAEYKQTSVVPTLEAIARLIEAQVRQRMLATVNQEYAFRVVDRALPPDVDDPVGPNRLLMFVLGPLLGFLGGVSIVVLREALRGILRNEGAIRS